MIEKSTIIVIAYCIYYVCGYNSSEATCLDELLPCSGSAVGNLFLMIVYGLILGKASSTIADGSELLLEILNPGIIGGVVLPILGALPDSMIILFSALGTGTTAQIQAQLAVGVGTLAGGTIMLLTIAWSSSVLVGRCDIKNGVAVDNQRSHRFRLYDQGVTVNDDLIINAKIMIWTSLTYWIIQGPAFYYLAHPNSAGQAVGTEKGFAIAGFIIAVLNLIGYCIYQVINPTLQKRKMEAARRRAVVEKVLGAFRFEQESIEAKPEPVPLDPEEESKKNLEEERKKNESALTIGQQWRAKAQAKKVQSANSSEDINKEQPKEEEESSEEEPPTQEMTTKQIIIRSTILLTIGTVFVTVFSDPMVTSITQFAAATNISPFYVSFIVSPLASNASELIAALIFASKRKKENMSLTMSSLYGAATMNNTMCLGLFLALIAFQGLRWEFSAETIVIFITTFAVGIFNIYRTTFKVWQSFAVLLLYPLSLIIVIILELPAIGWQ